VNWKWLAVALLIGCAAGYWLADSRKIKTTDTTTVDTVVTKPDGTVIKRKKVIDHSKEEIVKRLPDYSLSLLMPIDRLDRPIVSVQKRLLGNVYGGVYYDSREKAGGIGLTVLF